ncbi:MAG TPA: DUF6259 domain-containing protein [Bacteroidota bacterium]
MTRVVCESLQIEIGEGPGFPARVESAGHVVCAAGRQQILVRSLLDPSEPAFLVPTRRLSSPEGTVRLAFVDESKHASAELTLAPSPDGIRCSCTVKSRQPVWLFEWRLDGLALDQMVIPALGGQALSSAMPVDTTMSYKYPFWWSAQFAVGMAGPGGIWLSAREKQAHLKLLRIRRYVEGFALTYGVEAVGPVASRSLAGTWYLDGFRGDWTVPVEKYRPWMEQAFQPVKLAANPYVPPWFYGVNAVLELWGMRKDQGTPHHTFAQMEERLRAWEKIHPPARTLVYLPGFAEHGIDSHAPDYDPSEQLGGQRGFKRLVDTAHRMGYRVMIHTNALAMTFTHRLYRRFRKHQVVDVFGRAQGWALDIDGDWLAEPYFAYMNPGAPAWTKLMEGIIGRLIRKYKVDGVFLDQTLLAFNVARGPNFMEGMRAHIGRLQRAFPHVLFAGEGMHEHVLAVLPMAQIHGIDSITEVHGLDHQVRWRTAHPVSTRLFSPYTRFVAHLLTRHPSNPVFALQEKAYAELGVIPALCLYDAAQPVETPEAHAMAARANSIAPIASP